MKKFIILSLIVIFMIPVNLTGAEKIIFAVADFPPYQYVENGASAGICPDIVREISKQLGFEVEFQQLPWKRALRDVTRGDITGLVAVYKTEERAGFLYFTSETILTVKNIIIAKKGSNIKVSSLDDLKNKVVGVANEHSYGAEFDSYQGLKKEYANTLTDLLKMLDKGRMDVVATYNGPFYFTSKNLGMKENFEVLHVISEDPVYIGISKAMGKKGEALANQFSDILSRMKSEGTSQKIIEKYE